MPGFQDGGHTALCIRPGASRARLTSPARSAARRVGAVEEAPAATGLRSEGLRFGRRGRSRRLGGAPRLRDPAVDGRSRIDPARHAGPAPHDPAVDPSPPVTPADKASPAAHAPAIVGPVSHAPAIASRTPARDALAGLDLGLLRREGRAARGGMAGGDGRKRHHEQGCEGQPAHHTRLPTLRTGQTRRMLGPSRAGVNGMQHHCRSHEVCPGLVEHDLSGFHRTSSRAIDTAETPRRGENKSWSFVWVSARV